MIPKSTQEVRDKETRIMHHAHIYILFLKPHQHIFLKRLEKEREHHLHEHGDYRLLKLVSLAQIIQDTLLLSQSTTVHKINHSELKIFHIYAAREISENCVKITYIQFHQFPNLQAV